MKSLKTCKIVKNLLCSGSVGDWLNLLSFDSFERFSFNIEMTSKIETSKFTKKRAQLQSIVNKKTMNKEYCQIICSSQIVQQMVKFNKQNLPTIFDADETIWLHKVNL